MIRPLFIVGIILTAVDTAPTGHDLENLGPSDLIIQKERALFYNSFTNFLADYKNVSYV
jgi:hypothetical protein